jgi:hypothetical protein
MINNKEGRATAAQTDTQSTLSSTLDLTNGVLTLTITETADRVFVAFTGSRGRAEELARFLRFIEPILARYEHDARPIEISASHSPVTGLMFDQAVGVLVRNSDLANFRAGLA